MRKYFCAALLLTSCTIANAQLTGIKNIPGDYVNLATAITDLNTQGVGTGGVTLNLVAGNPQTAPAGGYAITATGTPADQVLITGNNNIITAPNPQPTGSLNDALFKIIGGDYITISAFVLQENAGNTVNSPATNTMTEWGIALLRAGSTDGAQYNTIQNNVISLDRLYDNTWGIYSNSCHTTTDVQTLSNPTAASGTNSHNAIYSNQISNTNRGLAVIGSASAFRDEFNDIGGSATSTGNTITNWGKSAAWSAYAYDIGMTYGIFLNHQVNSNVSFNTLVSANVIGSTPFRGILMDELTVNGTVVSTISNNTLTITSNQLTSSNCKFIDCRTGTGNVTVYITDNLILNCSGGPNTNFTIEGISCTGSPDAVMLNNNTFLGNTIASASAGFTCINCSANASDSIHIDDNHIGTASGNGISFPNGSNGLFRGIYNMTGGVNTTLSICRNDFRTIGSAAIGPGSHIYIENYAPNPNTIINQNTFTEMNCFTSGTITFINNNVTHAGNTSHFVNDNSVVGGYTRSSGAGDVYLYNSYSGVADSTVTETNTGNNFSNITVPGTGIFYGWRNCDGSTVFGPTKTICNNTFDSITAGSGAVTILDIEHQTPFYTLNSICNNTISHITSTGDITCINSGFGGVNMTGNVIHDISGGGTIYAISVGRSDQGGAVSMNKIYNVQTSANAVYGIRVYNWSDNVVVSNNYVGDLTAPNADTTNAVIGLYTHLNNGATRFYFNTVYLNATSTGTNFGSSGITAYSGGVTEMQNNLIVNLSAPNGIGKTVAFRRTGNFPITTYDPASDHNAFYAGIPGANHLIYSDNNVDFQNMLTYTAFVSPADSNAVSENTPFVSVTGSSPQYLHVAAGSYSVIESAGGVIVGINYDFDSDVRPGPVGSIYGGGTAPDIGADEFDGQGPCSGMPFAGTGNSPAPLCRGSMFVLSFTGASSGVGITYQWMESPTPGGPYANVPGATGPAFTTNAQYIDKYYIAIVTCASSGQSDTIADIPALVYGPVVTFQLGLDTLCWTDNPLTLSGTPSGGMFSGNGVTGSSFDPGAAGTGQEIIAYTVNDTVSGCTVTMYDTIYVDYCMGLTVTTAGVAVLSPNPASGNILVQFGADISAGEIRILNALGQEVVRTLVAGSSSTIDVSHLAPGIYFVAIYSDEFSATVEFIRE